MWQQFTINYFFIHYFYAGHILFIVQFFLTSRQRSAMAGDPYNAFISSSSCLIECMSESKSGLGPYIISLIFS